MKQLALFLFAVISSYCSFSQPYKTLLLPKDKTLSGVIQTATMPQNVPPFELLTHAKSNYWKDSLLLSSKKVVRFQVNTKDYRHHEILYAHLITENPEILTDHPVQLSAYFETDSATFTQEMYAKNHASLKADHLFSLEIDTTKNTLYIVLVFEPSFSGEMAFQLSTRVRPNPTSVPYKFGFRNCYYYHPYDYALQPFPFVEALFAPKQQFVIQASLRLNNQAFEEPSLAEGTDSLFYSTLMNNIIALARERQINMAYLELPMLFQLQFDEEGKLLDIRVSAFEPFPPSYLEYHEKTLRDIDRIREVVPRTFKWKAAKNFQDQPIAYTKDFILYMDTYWN